MARKSIEERLAQIEVQRKTLKARLGQQERKDDTRRKVLLSALVLHRLARIAMASSPNASVNGCAANCPASSPAMPTRNCLPIFSRPQQRIRRHDEIKG